MAQTAQYPNRFMSSQPSGKPASEAVTGNGVGAVNWEERKDPTKYEFGDGRNCWACS